MRPILLYVSAQAFLPRQTKSILMSQQVATFTAHCNPEHACCATGFKEAAYLSRSWERWEPGHERNVLFEVPQRAAKPEGQDELCDTDDHCTDVEVVAVDRDVAHHHVEH